MSKKTNNQKTEIQTRKPTELKDGQLDEIQAGVGPNKKTVTVWGYISSANMQ